MEISRLETRRQFLAQHPQWDSNDIKGSIALLTQNLQLQHEYLPLGPLERLVIRRNVFIEAIASHFSRVQEDKEALDALSDELISLEYTSALRTSTAIHISNVPTSCTHKGRENKKRNVQDNKGYGDIVRNDENNNDNKDDKDEDDDDNDDDDDNSNNNNSSSSSKNSRGSIKRTKGTSTISKAKRSSPKPYSSLSFNTKRKKEDERGIPIVGERSIHVADETLTIGKTDIIDDAAVAMKIPISPTGTGTTTTITITINCIRKISITFYTFVSYR